MFLPIKAKKLSQYNSRKLEKFKLFFKEKAEWFGGPQYKTFGLFGILNYLLFYIIWKCYNPVGYESFSLRLIATILNVPLLLVDYWPPSLKAWIPVYWYLVLLYCVPFFFFFMLFMNHGANIWLMGVNSIICWLPFIVEPISCFFILFLGILFAYLAFLINYPNATFNIYTWWGAIAQLIISFLLAMLFTQKKYYIIEKKLQAMQTLAGTLAHEIRTPLASVTANIEGVLARWPTLINAYQIAKKTQPDIELISSSQFNLLEKAFDRVKREINCMHTVINMLLMNVTLGRIKCDQTAVVSINECIEQALSRYPFSNDQQNLIDWEKTNNFLFKGNNLLVIHILFNLLKNALYHIKAANKGYIRIWLNSTDQYHQLHFRDTARGIASSLLPHVFECFFSKTYHGSGIGLTFCKAAMESFGGAIECQSKEGEYAEFILKFPKSCKASLETISQPERIGVCIES